MNLGRFFSDLILTQSARLLGREVRLSQGGHTYTHRATRTGNKRTRTSMPRVGFALTIPVFKRAKTVHALDCAATEIAKRKILLQKLLRFIFNGYSFFGYVVTSVENSAGILVSCYISVRTFNNACYVT
jgi:hypothetical protein